MKRVCTLFLLLVLFLSCYYEHARSIKPSAPLVLCSWNIQSFGWKKLKDKEVIGRIIKVISKIKPDILLIQEERAKIPVYQKFCEMLNKRLKTKYYVLASKRLGRRIRTISKERYLFLINSAKKISVLKFYESDFISRFERPPVAALMMFQGKKFIVVNFHSKPRAALVELENLFGVALYQFQQVLGEYPMLVCGDFNLSGKKIKNKLQSIAVPWQVKILFKHPDYTSLSGKLYDNIILCGEGIKENMHYVFKEPIITRRVSDHYPIVVSFVLTK